jgi:osmotically-inducible protein OsmY
MRLARSTDMQANTTDSKLMHDVLEELKWDTRVDETEVGVQVHSGIVTLTGTVGTWAKRVAARAAAHRVVGVRDVADELQVKLFASATPSDVEIAEAARAAMKWNVVIPEEHITMTVSHGIVTLAGSVDDASQRDEVVRSVGQLEGVRAINNEIKLLATVVSPARLRAAIEAALTRHATREAKKVLLDIEGGTVTISGEVDSLAERQAVIGAVSGTRGVATVVDHTRIG